MLGAAVEARMREEGFDYVASDAEVDITDKGAVENFVSGRNVTWIINAAAYTDVDGAEREKAKAFSVNAEAVRNLATVSEKIGAVLIHISTDYVFDGEKKSGYKEDDEPCPLNAYGESKLKGEMYVRDIAEKHFIVRTAWLYGENGKNFVDTMLRLMKEKDEIEVVSDQFGSPTYAGDLADFILKIVKRNSREYGTYHFTNAGVCSWFDFAWQIYALGRKYGVFEREVELIPVKTEEFPRPARRPKFSVLAKEKIKGVFGVEPPDWKISLEKYISRLKA